MLDVLNNLNAVNAAAVIGIMGVLVFVVEIIVQLTKELPGIKKLPTKLYVISVAVIVTVLALLIYVSIAKVQLIWYYIVLAILGGFIVAYISMYGWEQLKDLYDRCKGGN